MQNSAWHQENIVKNGFTIIDDIYTGDEINAIGAVIQAADQSGLAFRKTKQLFAIRRLLKEIPGIKQIIFNDKLNAVINELFDGGFFVVKSIYFDKPENSNWFVAWHQDLTIAVTEKADLPGYGSWTVKQDQFAVQPPLDILQNNFTLRIHLDDTDEDNGALNVLRGSHLKGIYRVEDINWKMEIGVYCNVKAGGVMIMKPLLMHASSRAISNKKRRVMHIEFSKAELPDGIRWAEKD